MRETSVASNASSSHPLLTPSSIQTTANGFQELIRLAGFLDEVLPGLQLQFTTRNLRAVATGEDDFETGSLALQARGKFAAIHSSRHDEIGQQQINPAWMFCPDLLCLDAVVRF